MEISKCIKETFSVIGKEGSTIDGGNFIEALWNDANSNFDEISSLAKKDDEGNLAGIWGAMTDLTRSFMPWQNNFSEGLYLAGVEVEDDATTPKNWVKWTIPSFEYLYVLVENDMQATLRHVMNYMKENEMELAGAVHDFICPQEGKSYIFVPIRKL